MVLCAFGMHGHVPLDFRGTPIDFRYGEPDSPPTRTGCLTQERVYLSGRPSTAGLGDRTLLAGWLVPAAVQRLLDEQGPAAVRRLRGDFTLAHLTPDRSTLRLYRGPASTMPLFWRLTGGRLRWATDPRRLLDGPPRLSDVDVDLLPMLIAQRGFPHDRSWFSGVHRLPTGMCLRLDSGAGPVVSRFDALRPEREQPGSLRDAADGVRTRLAQAGARMSRPGAGAALLLSGGTDSAVVAAEVARVSGEVAGLHFTMDFPGFAEDRKSAEAVAAACGVTFLPYEMQRHLIPGGDYADVPPGGGLPPTHTPLQGLDAAVREARARNGMFVFSGLLADQIFAHDFHRGLFGVIGWSVLNPLVAGEPIWQLLHRTVRTSFAGSPTAGLGDYLRLMRALRHGDPSAALPDRNSMVHPTGFTAAAADQVTVALRVAAVRAGDQLRAALPGGAGGIPPGTTALYQVNEVLNSPNVHAAGLSRFLPHECFFASPFADRDVIEYALGLPNEFRLGYAFGATIDKLALRVAYAGAGLPPRVGARMQQARQDAFASVYVNRNFERCRSLLGDDSRLRALGLLSETFVRSMSPQTVHRNGAEITRFCVIEEWLRKVAP